MTHPLNRISLQLVGDISLNGRFCNPQYHKKLADNMVEVVRGAGLCDIRIGNFEAPLWGDGGVNALKTPRLCTTEAAAKCILPLGLDVALLGNNHVYDCLQKGFDNTVSFLRDNGIQYVGVGTTPEEAALPLILHKKGLRLAILNYVHADTNPNIPSDTVVYTNMFDEENVLSEVADLSKKVDIVLLHLHWGIVELVRYPTVEQRSFARRAVETGATVVACDHAHCLQAHEAWKSGHIFYGLGNFIFGDLDGWTWPELARRTVLANLEVSRDGVESVCLKYLHQKDLFLEWDSRWSRARVQRRLNSRIKLSDRLYRLVYKWELLYQQVIVPYFRFVKKSGGLVCSIFNIRKHHLKVVWDVLTEHRRK